MAVRTSFLYSEVSEPSGLYKGQSPVGLRSVPQSTAPKPDSGMASAMSPGADDAPSKECASLDTGPAILAL